jgi:hypothetical protein
MRATRGFTVLNPAPPPYPPFTGVLEHIPVSLLLKHPVSKAL